MDSQKRIEYLRNIDLFEHFSNQELSSFAEHVEELEMRANEVLFREGSPGNEMFILLEGSLKVFKESRFITIIRPVDYIGEMAIIEDKPRSATVQTIKPCMLLKITSEQFQEYLSRQPESLVSMMRTLSQRIRKNTEIIAEEFEKANILIHDMRNFLSAFLFLDMLNNCVSDEKCKRYIAIMRNGKNNLASMMEEAIANAKRLQRPRDFVEGSIVEMIDDIIESEISIHPDLEGKEVIMTVQADLPRFHFCELEIRRVLVNLILNAGQASPANSKIEIDVSREPSGIVVQVMDRGTGVPNQLKDKVFQTHFTTKEHGSGLGLTSCRHVVEKLHGGEISYHPRPGGGTVFTFSLPLIQQKS